MSKLIKGLLVIRRAILGESYHLPVVMLILFSVVFHHFSNVRSQTNWTHHSSNPALELSASGEWADYWLEPESIVRTDTAYHMWYWGASTGFSKRGIGYAMSSDGITWQRHENNPILSKGESGAWDEGGIGGGCVILVDTLFYRWFWGWNTDRSIMGIGLATSTDGITWMEYENNPVIPNTPTGTWDDFATLQYLNILYNGEQYMMWYCGCKDEYKVPGYYTMKIGCATSSDGITWTPYENNPILVESKTSSAWDYWKVEMPTVVKNQTGYHMWFHGDNGKSQIGYAHSDDGFNWTKCDDNPVLKPKRIGSWSQIGIMGPVVRYDASDNIYQMWYMGGSISNGAQISQIGYATAPNDTVGTVVQYRNRDGILERFSLYQNYPNPFNPSTTIEFECRQKSHVILAIYDILGRKIRTLVNQEHVAGTYTVNWDGIDEQGECVPGGIYIARLVSGDRQQAIKLTLIR